MKPLAAALLVALLAAPALAGAEHDEAMRSANQLRKGLDYEAALQQAQRARKAAAGRAERRDAAVLAGVLLYELGRLADAKAAFREALSQDLNASAPANVSPKLLEDFERERQAAKRRASRPAATGPQGSKLDEDDEEQRAASAELKAPVASAEPPPAKPVEGEVSAAVTPRASATPGARVAGLVVLGAGVVGLAVGAGFLADTFAAAATLDAAGRGGPVLSLDDAEQLKVRGQRSQLVGSVSLSVGSVLAVAGVLLAVLAPGAPDVAVSLGPHGGELVYRVRF